MTLSSTKRSLSHETDSFFLYFYMNFAVPLAILRKIVYDIGNDL